ncbi:hypothetical protein GCM10010430_80330 [Kitasatospora cystarginea]|uniref:DUF1963 domain-containing protein n=1 Tax=Kitasatospora cystarginea TaxID=58350 RepID=A0ABP5S000_9ACTN
MLTEDELNALVTAGCGGDEDAVWQLAEAVAAEPGRVAPHRERLLAARVFSRSEIWRGADGPTTRALVELADSADGNQYLLRECVAEGDPDVAREAFVRWRKSGDVGAHTRAAGWELEPSGERRELVARQAFELLAVDAEEAGEALFGHGSGQHCPWCGMELAYALDLPSGSAVARALALPTDDHVQVLACPCCTDFGTILSEYDGAGGCRWSTKNERPEWNGPVLDGWDPYPTRLVLGPARPADGSGTAWHEGGSTLGGRPEWIQDPEYPHCPRCGRTMRFLSMNDGADVWGGEGCLYVFADPECRTGAVLYQQS